jgi:multicomponent K+:H+ antiporter subunit F
MIEYAILIGLGMLAAALLLNAYRLIFGPTLPDRVVALDTMYINTVALIVLFGIYLENFVFFEVALLIAMMGFVGTVALSKFILRGDIIEP